MNEAFNKVIKSHTKLAVLSVLAVVLLSIGTTYSLFQIDKKNTKNQVIAIGDFDVQASATENLLLTDLYPESASKITDEDKKFTFSLSNPGTYDVEYNLEMTDVTTTFLQNNTEYSKYKKLDENYYKYINYKIDGGETHNLESAKKDDKFIVMTNQLKTGVTNEEHYIQFFIDNKDTTTEGAPNDINGSILSLDISVTSTAIEKREPNATLANLIANAKTDTPDFKNVATTDEGVYAMEDEDGMSYYFRGAVENNYVKFGKNTSGNDMYWRIIRINGNGTIRMIYDGTSAHKNGESSTDRLALNNVKYNTKYDDNKYVGYMYGGTLGEESTSKVQAQTNETDSNIKIQLEKWYEDNIVGTKYENYISDEVFCNDRSIPDSSQLGYAKSKTAYGAKDRAYNTRIPTFRCDMNTTIDTENDKFAVSEAKGNGKLKYPVGLITADEIMTAGGEISESNTNYYLFKGNVYWSLSSSTAGTFALAYYVNDTGSLYDGGAVSHSHGLAPVINLNADISKTLKGTGTMTDPYTI